MESATWKKIRKTNKGKSLLKSAHLSPALAQLKWSSLTKSDRKKLEQASKGKGWYEEKKTIQTKKGSQKKAPIHHKVAVRKALKTTMRKPLIREQPVSHEPEPELKCDICGTAVSQEERKKYAPNTLCSNCGEHRNLMNKVYSDKPEEEPDQETDTLSLEILKLTYPFAISHIETEIEERNPKFYLTRRPDEKTTKAEIKKMKLSLTDLDAMNAKYKEIYERQDREATEQAEWEKAHKLGRKKTKTGLEQSPTYLVAH